MEYIDLTLTELREIITFSDESYSIDDVQKIIKDNFFVIYFYNRKR